MGSGQLPQSHKLSLIEQTHYLFTNQLIIDELTREIENSSTTNPNYSTKEKQRKQQRDWPHDLQTLLKHVFKDRMILFLFGLST